MDECRSFVEPAIRSLQPCAIVATLAGALVLVAITALSLDAVPELAAKIVLGVSLPVFYGAVLGARSGPRRVPGRRPAARARVRMTRVAWPMTTCDSPRRPNA